VSQSCNFCLAQAANALRLGQYPSRRNFGPNNLDPRLDALIKDPYLLYSVRGDRRALWSDTWRLAAPIVVLHGRAAVGDEIGELPGARQVAARKLHLSMRQARA
jgi:hypothetical protein